MSNTERFLAVYDEIRTFALDLLHQKFAMDPARREYIKTMLDANCLGGKYNRGVCVVDVVASMAKNAPTGSTSSADPETLERTLHEACVAGWMIELLQAHFLVEDDIMDGSQLRRGRPCWYLEPGVTTPVAINDGLILLALATQIALHFFADRAWLPRLLRAFHEVDLATTIGQFYDVTSMLDSKKLDPHQPQPRTTDYAEYTDFHYTRIVRYKTAYYTFWLPLQMALLVSGHAEDIDAATLERLAMTMGEYFQAQDDVMDCFTPPEKLGKIGTDIQDAKCTWLAVNFLAVASPAQQEAFRAHYGQSDAASIAKVKQLYSETNLLDRFAAYEVEVEQKVDEMIRELAVGNVAFACGVKKLWDRTFKREK